MNNVKCNFMKDCLFILFLSLLTVSNYNIMQGLLYFHGYYSCWFGLRVLETRRSFNGLPARSQSGRTLYSAEWKSDGLRLLTPAISVQTRTATSVQHRNIALQDNCGHILQFLPYLRAYSLSEQQQKIKEIAIGRTDCGRLV